MSENQYLKEEFYNKPERIVIQQVPVPMRLLPRDCHDMPTLTQIAVNHIYRVSNDPDYKPEETFANTYKSKLRTTTHFDKEVEKIQNQPRTNLPTLPT